MLTKDKVGILPGFKRNCIDHEMRSPVHINMPSFHQNGSFLGQLSTSCQKGCKGYTRRLPTSTLYCPKGLPEAQTDLAISPRIFILGKQIVV